MKNTLRYLLIVLGLVSVLSVSAQALAQQPEIPMKSTSGMVYSGSSLPQAAATGPVTTYDDSQNSRGPQVRKGWGSGSGEPGDRPEPYEDPIGDAALPLALLACAYICIRAFRKKRA